MEKIEAVVDLMTAGHRLGLVVARETGSTTPAAQWRALSVLVNHGPLRLGALADACRVTQPGITRLVRGMTTAGLVEKDPDPSDARAVVIRITDAGRAARIAWIETVREVLAPRFADLTDGEWSAVFTTAALLAERTSDISIGAE